MSRHLVACVGRGDALHVAVDGGDGTWWMFLALAPDATLDDLDDFLRKTWLECCEHLSGFRIGKTVYDGTGEGLGWTDEDYRSTTIPARLALPPGTTGKYEYDYGDTTRLRVRSIGTIAAGDEGPVTLLARNAPIAWPCDVCEGPAVEICPQCQAMSCGACEPPCDCDTWEEENTLPVVNSPRMGVCGYEG